MLDACATGFLCRQNCNCIIVDYKKNRSSGTQCVLSLSKAKVISRVNVEYQFPDFITQYVTLLKSEIHTMYCVKWKMTKLFLTYREKLFVLYLIFKDYSIFCIDINTILFLMCFQLNSIIACYVCVQLIKFIYIYI